MSTSIKFFLSYAPEDTAICKRLEAQLSQFKRLGIITIWHSGLINPGTEHKQAIERHLNEAHIILLLISVHFIASEHCNSVQQRAIERHQRGTARVIPILLRPVVICDAQLSKLHPIPTNGKPITAWHSQEQALATVAEDIKKVIQTFRGQQDKVPAKDKPLAQPRHPKPHRPAAASTARPVEPRHPVSKPNSPFPPAHTTNHTVFQGQVQGAVTGSHNTHNTIHIHNMLSQADDPIAKGRAIARQGYTKLQHQDYMAARQCLEAANLALAEDALPAEAAQIKYHLALTLLDGQRPAKMSIAAMQQVEHLLKTAIALQPLHSYYATLALFVRDFARHGLPQYRKQHVQHLARTAQRIKRTKIDEDNFRLLTSCQPRLMHDAQQWSVL